MVARVGLGRRHVKEDATTLAILGHTKESGRPVVVFELRRRSGLGHGLGSSFDDARPGAFDAAEVAFWFRTVAPAT
jgi:hypothetical protein